jgi:hypothetical protein
MLHFEPLKLTENNLCKLCWMWSHSNSVHSIPSWLSGIEHFLSNHNRPRLPRGEFFKKNLAGLQNIFGSVDKVIRATPLTETHLRALYNILDHTKKTDAILWCSYVFAFQGLLRLSEFSNKRMKLKHVTRTSHGLQLTVPFSKTDLTPTNIQLVQRDDILCPVKAFDNAKRFLSDKPKTPIFSFTKDAFRKALQFCIKNINGPKGVTSHSFRRGGTTALVEAEVPESYIMAHGRWTSQAWRKYIDFGLLQQHFPTKMLMLNRS